MTITALLLVSGMTFGQTANLPAWQVDYSDAQSKGVQSNRPLAVFVGKGTAGVDDCCREGKLNAVAVRLLSEHYVCAYVDAQNPANKALVTAFALGTGKGVVLSDRSGKRQVFHHDGPISAPDLLKALRDTAGVSNQLAEPLRTFTTANFKTEVLNSKEPVLVDFFADWCGPCQRMQPVVRALSGDFQGLARIGKLNTDQASGIATEYGVSAIPAFLIFQNGRVVDRVVGATSKEELAARINALLR